MRNEFYRLKERLLRKHGTLRGHDIQEITKECWGWRRWDYDAGEYEYLPCGPDCRRCGGTGIFDQRWVRLERWQWGKYVFHIPSGDTRIKPDSVQIRGRIEHPYRGRIHNEAALWLFLLCGEWALFWRAMCSWSCCGWYGWPLTNMQRVTMWLAVKLRRQKCWCGKWYWTWGSGWQVCPHCRREPDDIPF